MWQFIHWNTLILIYYTTHMLHNRTFTRLLSNMQLLHPADAFILISGFDVRSVE